MAPRIPALTLTVVTLLCGAPLCVADDASLGKDLKATIALQGMPCDRLVEAKRHADSDYTAGDRAEAVARRAVFVTACARPSSEFPA